MKAVLAEDDIPSDSIELPAERNLFIICDEMARRLLTDFELMIMLAILRLRDGAYGVPIAREIEDTAGRMVTLGAVYLALDRLQQNGLVLSELGEATAERGGRAKRFFRITPKGLTGSPQYAACPGRVVEGNP